MVRAQEEEKEVGQLGPQFPQRCPAQMVAPRYRSKVNLRPYGLETSLLEVEESKCFSSRMSTNLALSLGGMLHMGVLPLLPYGQEGVDRF